MFQYHIIFNDHLTLCVAQRQSHFVYCSTTVSLCVSLNDHLTLCVAQRPSHFVCRSTTISLCVLLNDHLTLCVAQRPSHFVCRSTTISLCVSLNDHLTLCVAGSSPTSASVSACVLTVAPTTRCGMMRRAAVAVRTRHRVARRARKRRERATCTMTTTGASKLRLSHCCPFLSRYPLPAWPCPPRDLCCCTSVESQ